MLRRNRQAARALDTVLHHIPIGDVWEYCAFGANDAVIPPPGIVWPNHFFDADPATWDDRGSVTDALALEPQIEQLARDLAKSRDVLYLGRGTSFPIALEGALKLKEISYIHAEGYAAGELKHGPIALVDETMPVIVIAPYDRVFEKTVSNMQEVAARGGRLILVTDAKGAAAAEGQPLVTLTLPTMPSAVAPLVYAVPVQLIAYHTAVIMGTDVDQPRNLAKSVTVE